MKNNAPLFLLRLVCPVAGSPGSALESRCPFSRNTGNTMLMPTAARLFRKTHGGWPRPLLKWKNYARRRPLHEINQATAAHVYYYQSLLGKGPDRSFSALTRR